MKVQGMSARTPEHRIKTHPVQTATMIAIAGSVSLAVAMGVGRFAFTPILPMMLHDRVLGLDFASNLATANYLGYLAGAMLCMGLPKIWSQVKVIRGSLVLTILLTAAMAVPLPWFWIPLRFLAGVASAIAFVFTSGWCLAELHELNEAALGSAIYTGPGAGIALSGLAADLMGRLGWTGQSAWISFGVIAAAMSAAVWHVFRGRDPVHHRKTHLVVVSSPHPTGTGSAAEMALFAIAYGLAGFGYIITATYLPVMAKAAIPDSPWLSLFWPVFGFAAVAGSLIAARDRTKIDPRIFLVIAYLGQALGVVLTLILHTTLGFALSSVLVGLPFTAISFFSMQEVRRLRPHHHARFMGMLTALYGIGQISGPPVVGLLLQKAGSVGKGFDMALAIASATLVLGAVIYVIIILRWPIAKARSAQ
jgi:MFS family permease